MGEGGEARVCEAARQAKGASAAGAREGDFVRVPLCRTRGQRSLTALCEISEGKKKQRARTHLKLR